MTGTNQVGNESEEAQAESDGPYGTARDSSVAGRAGPGSYLAMGVIGAVGMALSFFFWGITRSSYIHEGGDPSNGPQGPMIVMILFAILLLASVILGIAAATKKE